jgi:hypothetical protein
MLPNRQRNGAGWEPALPLILAAWGLTTNAAKRERFVEHLEHAQRHGVLDEVVNYLSSIKDEQWHSEGDM